MFNSARTHCNDLLLAFTNSEPLPPLVARQCDEVRVHVLIYHSIFFFDAYYARIVYFVHFYLTRPAKHIAIRVTPARKPLCLHSLRVWALRC